MSKGNNSPGVSKLAGVMRKLANKDRDGSLLLDFGVIQTDKSLLTNTYPIPIPRSDYQVCRAVMQQGDSFTTSYNGEDSHRHTGSVTINPALKPGDRVLVAWVQNDAIVIDILFPAASVL